MGSRCIAEEVRSKRTKREEIIYNQNLMALGGAGIWLVCKGTYQKRFSGIRPLRGGGTPLFR